MMLRKASLRPDREAGFTLIELLVSLMLLTLVLSFIPGVLRIGQRAWETDDAFQRRAGLAAFRRYLEQRLAEAMPIHRRDRTSVLNIEFTGEPHHLVFIAPAASGPAGGGVYRFELRRQAGSRGARPLLLRQTLYRAEGEPAPSLDHRSDIRLTGLSLRYFGAPGDQQPAGWQATWARRDALPDLVEIAMKQSGIRTQRVVVSLRLKTP